MKTVPKTRKDETFEKAVLTKRELISAMILQGLISGCYSGNNAGFTVHGNCVAALEYADALIAELDKE